MNKYVSSVLIALIAIAGLFLAPAIALNVLLVAVLCIALAFIVANLSRDWRRQSLTQAINFNEGTHKDALSKLTDAAIATRFLFVKFGTDADHIAINGASDKPLGLCTDEAAAAEERVSVALLGGTQTRLCVVSEAIALTDELWTAANGKVQNATATAGTYYKVGRPLQIGSADGDVIEFQPCFPVAIVVT